MMQATIDDPGPSALDLALAAGERLERGARAINAALRRLMGPGRPSKGGEVPLDVRRPPSMRSKLRSGVVFAAPAAPLARMDGFGVGNVCQALADPDWFRWKLSDLLDRFPSTDLPERFGLEVMRQADAPGLRRPEDPDYLAFMADVDRTAVRGMVRELAA